MNRIHRFVIALLFTAASSLAFADYSSIIAFGDSLSDNGNAYRISGGLIPPSPPYFDGRVSNGPVAVEYMAEALRPGMTLVDYAVAGAKTGAAGGSDSAIGLNGTGLPAQVDMFADALAGAPADASALFMVWGGPNDYLQPGLTPPQSVENIGGVISELYGLGARDFFVPNMPDLGRIPRFVGDAQLSADMSQISKTFNDLLAREILDLDSTLVDARLIPFDTYGFFADALDDPAAFGFSDVTQACVASPRCLADPALQATTLFWDFEHPNTLGHAFLGQAFAQVAVVPEPASVLMFVAGLGVIGLRRRRRSAA